MHLLLLSLFTLHFSMADANSYRHNLIILDIIPIFVLHNFFYSKCTNFVLSIKQKWLNIEQFISQYIRLDIVTRYFSFHFFLFYFIIIIILLFFSKLMFITIICTFSHIFRLFFLINCLFNITFY